MTVSKEPETPATEQPPFFGKHFLRALLALMILSIFTMPPVDKRQPEEETIGSYLGILSDARAQGGDCINGDHNISCTTADGMPGHCGYAPGEEGETPICIPDGSPYSSPDGSPYSSPVPEMPVVLVPFFLLITGGIVFLLRRKMKKALQQG